MPQRHLKGSWLKGYLKCTEEQEAPELFHLWVGMTIIASVLDRDVWIDHGYFKVYPNMYVVLVAGSQKCRKSTAIDMGLDVLQDLEEHPTLISQKITPQALIGKLAEEATRRKVNEGRAKSAGLIVADEISTYLDQNAIKQGMFPILLKLHDCQSKFTYETKSRGEEIMYNTYLNLLAGSSPEYLRKSFPADESGGGMLARTVLVYQDKPKGPKPFPKLSDEVISLRRRVVHDLEIISKLEGEVELTHEALGFYEDWYCNSWYEGRDNDYPEVLKHYVNKKPDHLQKVATIISVAKRDNLKISKEDLQSALSILEKTEQHMHKPLSTIAADGSGVTTQTVKDAISVIYSYNNRPTYKAIMRKVHKSLSYDELREGIETLLRAELIEQRTGEDGKVYFLPNEDRDRKEWED